VKRDYIFFVLPALIIIILDQISKLMVAGHIRNNQSIQVIENFFSLIHTRNRGMAFGLMNRPEPGLISYTLIAASITAIVLIVFWFTTFKGEEKRLIPGLSIILGGAVGNLIDRLRLGEVIDFLDFYIGDYHWPAFNVADSAITVGVIFIVINILFLGPQDSEKEIN
jgi:signal peptidase II